MNDLVKRILKSTILALIPIIVEAVKELIDGWEKKMD